jgi:hypothetical protein
MYTSPGYVAKLTINMSESWFTRYEAWGLSCAKALNQHEHALRPALKKHAGRTITLIAETFERVGVASAASAFGTRLALSYVFLLAAVLLLAVT